MLTGFPIETGLQPGGSRAYVFNLVDSIRLVSIDGYVQRVPVHDLKVVIRGTEDDVKIVLQTISNSIPIECGVQQISLVPYIVWPHSPRFKILASTSAKALKSDLSGDDYDNKSNRSKSSNKSS